jgi:hypothetical protein
LIICIDPGSKKAGVSLFEEDGTLMTAWLAVGADWRETADNIMRKMPVSMCRVNSVVVERMQYYEGSDVPVEDLITLSLMAGRVTGLFSGWVGENTFTYLPKQWKGQVPKDIMIARIISKLTPAEVRRVQLPKTKVGQKDVWDAVGIGLHHLRKKRRA